MKCKDMMVRKALLPVLEHPLDDQCRSHNPNMHCFKGGDSRTNEQPGLAAMHTIWMREHNRLVKKLNELNPHWADERLFHGMLSSRISIQKFLFDTKSFHSAEARKIVGAQMQHITYNEFLPLILGIRLHLQSCASLLIRVMI